MLSQVRKGGQIRKTIKLKCQGSKLKILLSGMKFASSGEKNETLQRIGKRYTYELDKMNA